MKQKKAFVLFIALVPTVLMGQWKSILSSQLPESFLGSWEDEKNNITLIVTPDYVIVQNKLWYFNKIEKENDVINFTCVNNFNTKYISISGIGTSGIYLDEGYRITKLAKVGTGNAKRLPETLMGNWHSAKDGLQVLSDHILFSGNTYSLDYFVSTDDENHYFVLYNDGGYYFCFVDTDDKGQFLYTDFSKEIRFKKESFFRKHLIGFISIAILSLCIIGFYLFRWKIALTKRKEESKRKYTEMQLKSIRSQMNPHFLFNALCAIQNLINKGDNNKANHYLIEFSQLIRTTLDKSEKGLVSLSEEIESIKKYLELENLRFPFEYSIRTVPEIDIYQTEIPAMLIQPFVENAIIHGLNEINGDKKLRIEFKIETGYLLCLITDNGVGIKKTRTKRETGSKRERYGLKLAKERIGLINESYKTQAKIEIVDRSEKKGETGTIVKIYTPLAY